MAHNVRNVQGPTRSIVAMSVVYKLLLGKYWMRTKNGKRIFIRSGHFIFSYQKLA
jgi:hypothetical protein